MVPLLRSTDECAVVEHLDGHVQIWNAPIPPPLGLHLADVAGAYLQHLLHFRCECYNRVAVDPHSATDAWKRCASPVTCASLPQQLPVFDELLDGILVVAIRPLELHNGDVLERFTRLERENVGASVRVHR